MWGWWWGGLRGGLLDEELIVPVLKQPMHHPVQSHNALARMEEQKGAMLEIQSLASHTDSYTDWKLEETQVHCCNDGMLQDNAQAKYVFQEGASAGDVQLNHRFATGA